MKNRNRIAAGITGAVLVGALVIGQAAPAVLADDKETSLALTETEADAVLETEAPETEKKEYAQLETTNASDAVITAIEKVEELGIYEKYRPDIVLFDVLGDVVCGGFAMPMRAGYADYVYILTSGETMSLYAAANIGLALEHFQGRGYARLGGLILNRRDVPDEENKVRALAAELGTELTGSLSRSATVLEAEERGQSVLQAFPDSEMAEEYRMLAEVIAGQAMAPAGK